MSNVIQEARDRLAELTVTAFGLGGNERLFDIQVAAKIDWRSLMQKVEENSSATGLIPPYGVLAYGPARTEGGALNSQTMMLDITVVCVEALKSGGTARTSSETRTLIEDSLLLLRTNIFAETTANAKFQAWDAVIDTDQDNPANSYYLQYKLPLYAGIMTMPIMVGTT